MKKAIMIDDHWVEANATLQRFDDGSSVEAIWYPHPQSPKYITLYGHTDAVVRVVAMPPGHLWQYGKQYGYEPTIEQAKAMVDSLAVHYSIPPGQRWMSL